MKYLFCLVTFLISHSTFANPMAGAISGGMGGTGRAAAQSNESLYLNPASLALMSRLYWGTSYQTGFYAKDVSRNTYSINFTDGTPETIVPGSFGYRRHKINQNGLQLLENEFKAGIGYSINPRISIGVGLSHLDAEESGVRSFKQTNGDLGLLIGIKENFGISFTGENLIAAKKDLPEVLKRRSLTAIGAQYIFNAYMTARYEALMPLYENNSTKLAHRAGLGFLLQGYFMMSAGYSIDDNLGQNWASFGLAWLGPRLKIGYSFQNEERQGLRDRHLVDLWVDL